MNKTTILPIVTTVFLVVQAVTGQEVEQDLIDQVATGISILAAAGVTVWGIFKNHEKEE